MNVLIFGGSGWVGHSIAKKLCEEKIPCTIVSRGQKTTYLDEIPHIPAITDEVRALAGDPGSSLGTGGMITKFSAASIALEKDIPVVIMNGAAPELLYDLFDGKQIGTFIG